MSVRTAYKWDEISETAKHGKILEMAKNARSPTKPYYTMGYYKTQENEEIGLQDDIFGTVFGIGEYADQTGRLYLS